MTRQEIQGEITACKSLLANSDYTILKTLEGMMTCTSATGIINYLKELTAELFALKEKRQSWRDKINEMEAQLAALDAEEAAAALNEQESYTAAEDELEADSTVEPEDEPVTE